MFTNTIETHFADRYGRSALFVPSGRYAIHLILREWLSPGSRVLISPINCDAVLFGLLSAGAIPVFAPVDKATGNLAIDKIPSQTWESISAVLTTNLYGIPDSIEELSDRCRRNSVLLIEDACQALETSVAGKRVGAFGDVGVLSLNKHFFGVGAVIICPDRKRLTRLKSRLAETRRKGSIVGLVRENLKYGARNVAKIIGLLDYLKRTFKGSRIRPIPYKGTFRANYDLTELQAASELAKLNAFDEWLSIGNPNFRTVPSLMKTLFILLQMRAYLQSMDNETRVRGARKLMALDIFPDFVRLPESTGLYRVPLFVKNRYEVIKALSKKGFKVSNIYDPPLDEYVRMISSDSRRVYCAEYVWSRFVLPVDPLEADRFIGLLGALDVEPQPVDGPQVDSCDSNSALTY